MPRQPCGGRPVGDPVSSTAYSDSHLNTLRHFGSYRQARADFLTHAQKAGAHIRRYVHPRFPDLSVDVAIVRGEVSTAAALVLVSGTHGIEGHAGSAIQRQFLREAAEHRMLDTILIHGLNPHGFAHDRRVDENNVDVNRNFVDFQRPPTNTDYARLHDLLVPEDWNGPAHQQAQSSLLRLLQDWGPTRLQSAITHGQYTHPDGLFFGGNRPSWSNETLQRIISEHVLGHPYVAYIDLHTGLGEPGVGEPIFRGGTDPEAYNRARSWYGEDLTCSEDGTSSSTQIEGNTASAVAALLQGNAMLTAITLEFGTLDPQTVLTALQGDNWFQLRHEQAHAGYRPVGEAMAAAFAPRNPGWQRRMMSRGAEIIGLAERSLLRLALQSSEESTYTNHQLSHP
jgi:hypothetical protein